MSTRGQNETKFGQWAELPAGGRRYWLDVVEPVTLACPLLEGSGLRRKNATILARDLDDQDRLVEIREKYPVDQGHQRV